MTNLTSAQIEAAHQIKLKIKFLKASRPSAAVRAEIEAFRAEYLALTGEAA